MQDEALSDGIETRAMAARRYVRMEVSAAGGRGATSIAMNGWTLWPSRG